MTGVAGNVYTLAFGKQSAKGTLATDGAGVYKLKLTNGSIDPQRQLLTLQETDATRQQGQTVVVGAQVQGTPEWYVRPSDFPLFAYVALGANADGGVSGAYTHTASMAQNPPYLSVWKNVGAGVLVDQYKDVRISTLELSGGAGQAVSCKADFMGLDAVFGATDSTQPVVSELPFVYPEVAVSIGGSVPGTVENFTITINNNADFIQADNKLGPYDVVLGRLEVSGSMQILFESDAMYRQFHTGASNGTAFSTNLYEQAIDIGMVAGTESIHAVMAGCAWTAVPVQPDTSGKPIRVAATFTSLPQALASDYIKFVTTNTVMTY